MLFRSSSEQSENRLTLEGVPLTDRFKDSHASGMFLCKAKQTMRNEVRTAVFLWGATANGRNGTKFFSELKNSGRLGSFHDKHKEVSEVLSF